MEHTGQRCDHRDHLQVHCLGNWHPGIDSPDPWIRHCSIRGYIRNLKISNILCGYKYCIRMDAKWYHPGNKYRYRYSKRYVSASGLYYCCRIFRWQLPERVQYDNGGYYIIHRADVH